MARRQCNELMAPAREERARRDEKRADALFDKRCESRVGVGACRAPISQAEPGTTGPAAAARGGQSMMDYYLQRSLGAAQIKITKLGD
jgi:hypothetical protein